MTARERVGVVVLIALFILLGAVFIWTFSGPIGNAKHGDFSESAIVKQSVINQQKSK